MKKLEHLGAGVSSQPFDGDHGRIPNLRKKQLELGGRAKVKTAREPPSPELPSFNYEGMTDWFASSSDSLSVH